MQKFPVIHRANEHHSDMDSSSRNHRVHHTKNSHTDMKIGIVPVPEQDLEDSPRDATTTAAKNYHAAKAYVNQLQMRNRSQAVQTSITKPAETSPRISQLQTSKVNERSHSTITHQKQESVVSHGSRMTAVPTLSLKQASEPQGLVRKTTEQLVSPKQKSQNPLESSSQTLMSKTSKVRQSTEKPKNVEQTQEIKPDGQVPSNELDTSNLDAVQEVGQGISSREHLPNAKREIIKKINSPLR